VLAASIIRAMSDSHVLNVDEFRERIKQIAFGTVNLN
jgi:hypothetical protein